MNERNIFLCILVRFFSEIKLKKAVCDHKIFFHIFPAKEDTFSFEFDSDIYFFQLGI